MSMKIERSTLEQVKARFAQNKKKLEEKKKDYDLEQRVKELKEEVCFFSFKIVLWLCVFFIHYVICYFYYPQEEKIKEYRKEKRKDKKRKIEELSEDDAGPFDEMAAIMGFSGFGSKKKWQTASVEYSWTVFATLKKKILFLWRKSWKR